MALRWEWGLASPRALGVEDEVALGLYCVGDNVGKVLSTVRGHNRVSKIIIFIIDFRDLKNTYLRITNNPFAHLLPA